jgi:hypothetical protein
MGHPLGSASGKKKEEERARAVKYPMCAKLSNSADERRTALELFEWLESKGYHICERSHGSNFSTYDRTFKSFDTLALEFLEIDPKKLEEERRLMLDEQRKLNDKKT